MIARTYPVGDLALDSLSVWTSGAEYAAQKIKQRLQFMKGEWAWDTSLGIAYYQDILVKGPNLSLIQEIYRAEILDVPGIVNVTEIQLEIEPATRLLSVAFSATFQDETGTFSVTGTA